MSEKKKVAEKKEDDGYTVKYKGKEHETYIYELGVFHSGSERIFRDPEEIAIAKNLVAHNSNFEEGNK